VVGSCGWHARSAIHKQLSTEVARSAIHKQLRIVERSFFQNPSNVWLASFASFQRKQFGKEELIENPEVLVESSASFQGRGRFLFLTGV
jgi:hypothetical protein